MKIRSERALRRSSDHHRVGSTAVEDLLGEKLESWAGFMAGQQFLQLRFFKR